VGASVASLRLSPMVGHRFPSPLSRLLRLQAVPFSALADPAFSVLHVDDAAQAVVAALRAGFDGPLNVTGGGAVTASQAARLGGRIPLPVAGLQWAAVRAVCGRVGAPVPGHLMELLLRGRAADGSRARDALGLSPRSTRQAIEDLYATAAPPALRVLEGAA
jgi:UDP-glucose 4-epimerase